MPLRRLTQFISLLRRATPARVAWFGLASLLLFLAAFAIWVAVATHQASDAVSRSTSLSNAYEAAHFAVASEEALERKYRLEPSPEVLRSHRAAAADLVAALESARVAGTADDARLVAQLLDWHRTYLASTARMFAAVDLGDSSLVLAIDNQEVDPVFGAIEARVSQAAADHTVWASNELANLARTEGFILVATPLVFIVGLVLLLLFRVAFRGYERRIQAGAQRELLLVRVSEERFRSLVQNAADVLVIAAADGRLRYASPAAERNWGHSPAALTGSRVSDVVHPEDLEAARAFFAECVRSTGVNIATQLRIRTADGTWRNVEVIGYNLLEDDSVSGVVLTLHDVTERKSFEEQLTKLAFRDPLTDLANRALFTDRLEQALARATRRMRSVGLLFLDIDNFKDVNDRLGHGAGDRLLVIVADRLRQVLRGEDTAARIGGDEFTVLIEEIVDEDTAIEIVSRIEAALAEPVSLDGHELSITASIGIAVGGRAAESSESLLRKADLAMYRAKANGKARHETFEPSMESCAMERIALETDLRHALGHGEFRVVYQPIVSLDNGRLVGVEALVRWDHPTRGLVMPADFIPFAEESGLIVPIGLAVLQDACRHGAAWNHDAPHSPIGVSVNLSARQFQYAGLVDDIGSALRDSGLNPALLTLEITESDVMRDPLVAADRLREIKLIGVKIAVDDFGTGYSSLAYLKNFPVDSLKIDRTFISGVGVDKDDSAIVRSVVALGHALDLSVTGEGIETPEQRAYLQDLGCDLGQGYLFDRPLPAAAIEAAIATHGRSSSPISRRSGRRKTA